MLRRQSPRADGRATRRPRGRVLRHSGRGRTRWRLRDATRRDREARGIERRDASVEIGRAEQGDGHVVDGRVAIFGFLLEGFLEDAAERLVDSREIRPRGEMLHEDLAEAVARERNFTGEQLVQHDAERVDVDPAAVHPGADLRCHVVYRADAHRLAALPRDADVLREAVVADLHEAVFVEDVLGLEIAVDDAAVVEVRESLRDFADEERRLLGAQALRVVVDQIT